MASNTGVVRNFDWGRPKLGKIVTLFWWRFSVT